MTEEIKQKYALLPPPRKPSLATKVALLLGGAGQFLWILAAIVLPIGFSSYFDTRGVVEIEAGRYERVIGKVTDIKRYSDDDYGRRYEYDLYYEYFVNGERYNDSCTTRVAPAYYKGENVGINYSKNYPERGNAASVSGCKLEGLGERNFLLTTGGIFFILLFFRFFRSIFHLHLLKNGKRTDAVLVDHKREEIKEVEGITHHALTFKYYAKETRQEYRLKVNTFFSRGLTDEPEEDLLYLPRAPKHAALLDAMNGSLQIQEDGTIEPEHGMPYLLLIAPAITLASPFLGYLLYLFY